MRGTKFFGVVIACILTLLLAVEAGSISAAWAAKPPGEGDNPPEGQTIPWGVDIIDADNVWGTTKGFGIKVAVLDDGIDIDHPDLNVTGGINTVGEKTGNDPSPEPNNYDATDSGHGTMIAGIIAALDNDFGVIGVAPDVALYAVRFRPVSGVTQPDQTPEFDHRDPTTYAYTDLYEAMRWCIDGPDGISGTGDEMQVISMSFGTWTVNARGRRSNPLHDPQFYSLIQEAYANDIILVSASGNDSRELQVCSPPPDISTEYSDRRYDLPASYPETIGISATTLSTTKGKPGEREEVHTFVSWSNYGPAIDLAAPGSRINSTRDGGGYGEGGGTSYAAPHVAATAALVLASGVPAADVRQTLIDTAEDLGDPGRDDYYGYGVVNAENAVLGTTSSAPPRYTLSPRGKLSTTWGKLKNE